MQDSMRGRQRGKAVPLQWAGWRLGKRFPIKITNSDRKARRSSPEFQDYYCISSDHLLSSSATPKEAGNLPGAGTGFVVSCVLYLLIHSTVKSLLGWIRTHPSPSCQTVPCGARAISWSLIHRRVEERRGRARVCAQPEEGAKACLGGRHHPEVTVELEGPGEEQRARGKAERERARGIGVMRWSHGAPHFRRLLCPAGDRCFLASHCVKSCRDYSTYRAALLPSPFSLGCVLGFLPTCSTSIFHWVPYPCG